MLAIIVKCFFFPIASVCIWGYVGGSLNRWLFHRKISIPSHERLICIIIQLQNATCCWRWIWLTQCIRFFSARCPQSGSTTTVYSIRVIRRRHDSSWYHYENSDYIIQSDTGSTNSSTYAYHLYKLNKYKQFCFQSYARKLPLVVGNQRQQQKCLYNHKINKECFSFLMSLNSMYYNLSHKTMSYPIKIFISYTN